MLIFLRHGRTAYNAEGRLQGQYDSPLDEVGWQQAKAVGLHLQENYDVARVITSAMTRTRQTVEAAGLLHLPTTVDDRWREIDFGAYDQRRIQDVHVDLGAKWAEDPEWQPDGGAESIATLHRRVESALVDVLEAHDRVASEQAIVIVSHATPIKSAIAHAALGGPPMILRLQIGLASVSTMACTNGVSVLTSFNERPFPPSLR
ncbi:MAG TPA: histidine phosphatase family protein [Acidimicrobiales bacterium]|nr:histidine phosphatase family protein [Acidimicrobiales bacterium]